MRDHSRHAGIRVTSLYTFFYVDSGDQTWLVWLVISEPGLPSPWNFIYNSIYGSKILGNDFINKDVSQL